MTVQPQQERRILNDEIEGAYVSTAYYSACIQNYYENQMGVIKESYELFYLKFVYLVKITEVLEQLQKDRDVVNEVKTWLKSDKGRDMRAKCEKGDDMFLKYATLLSDKGLLALPSRGGK
jgi:hypothetical protein